MNKRIKKKQALMVSVQNLMIVCDKLMNLVETQQKQIDDMNQVNSQNIEITNRRFDNLETFQKILEDDVAELKNKKKSFFRR